MQCLSANFTPILDSVAICWANSEIHFDFESDTSFKLSPKIDLKHNSRMIGLMQYPTFYCILFGLFSFLKQKQFLFFRSKSRFERVQLVHDLLGQTVTNLIIEIAT